MAPERLLVAEPCRVVLVADTCISEARVTNLALQITDKSSQPDSGIR